MNITWLRTIMRKHSSLGCVLAGSYLLMHWFSRRPALLIFSSISALCALWLFGYPRVRVQPAKADYTIVDIGVLPQAAECTAYGLNDVGQVVGVCTYADGARHAFVWHDGSIRDLGEGRGSSEAYGINNLGHIAGQREGIACMWRNGKSQSLGTIPSYSNSVARAISAKGDIAGYAYEGHYKRAFRWRKGKMTSIMPPKNMLDTLATGINDRSDVVGASNDLWPETEAFINIVGDPNVKRIYPLSGNNTATAINNSQQVVGFSNYPPENNQEDFHGFCWQNGDLHDLGTLGGARSVALAINDKASIVGWSEVSGGKQHGFVWQKNRMSDLNALLPKNSGWILEKAEGINNKGQIVGAGLHNGQRRAFLLTPNNG